METIGEKGVQSVDECGLSAHQFYESGHILRHCRVVGKIRLVKCATWRKTKITHRSSCTPSLELMIERHEYCSQSSTIYMYVRTFVELPTFRIQVAAIWVKYWTALPPEDPNSVSQGDNMDA